MSKCMEIVNRMSDEWRDRLLERVDLYIGYGVEPKKAQVIAANDMLAEIQTERDEFMVAVREQHPDVVTEESDASPISAAGYDASSIQGGQHDQRANPGDNVADQAGRDPTGGSPLSTERGEAVAAGLGGGPGQPAATAASHSQRHHQADDAVARLDAALRHSNQLEGNHQGIKADPTRADTQALNALLDTFARLTGKRGIAIDWTGGSYGLQHGQDFFINVSDPDMHVASTIGHEFKHLSEQFTGLAKLYGQLWNLVGESGKRDYFEYLQRTKQVQSESIEKASPKELKKLKDEMLADFMGKRFNDKAWLKTLSVQRPDLFGDFVRDWIKLLTGVIASLKGKAAAMAGVKNIDKYIAQLKAAKTIASDIATAWAVQNPQLAEQSGIEEVLERDVQLSWTAKPGRSSGLMPRMAVNSGDGAQREHLLEMKKALSAHGPEKMLWGTGRYKETVGGSGWKGITSYAVQSTLQLPDGKLDERTRNEVEFFLATRGMWLAQDVMSWHSPIYGQQGQGVEINLGGEKLTDLEFEELYAAVRHELNDYSVPPIPSKDGVRFLNFAGIEQGEFTEKLLIALSKTSAYYIFKDAKEQSNDAIRTSSTGRSNQSGTRGISENDSGGKGSRNGSQAGILEGSNSPLRPGSSNLSGGRDHDGSAFSSEGIRTFNLAGDLIDNDWSKGEGQYRERVTRAWLALKDLPGQTLPKTEADLNTYLDATQQRVDAVNAKYGDGWGKFSLTAQERTTGIGASYDFPAGQIGSDKAAKAYFKHPDGTLQTLYSGSISDIKEIVGGKGEHTKAGAIFFATTDPVYAAERAESMEDSKPRNRQKGVGQNIMPVYILASNPFDWRIMAHRDAVLAHMPKASDELVEALYQGEYAHIESKPVQKAIKAAGFDSLLVRNDSDDIGLLGVGIFNPEDVVFAIGVDGRKLAASDIQLSARDVSGRLAPSDAPQTRKRAFIGRTPRAYTPEQLKAFANVGFEVETPSLKERAKALWKDAGKKLAQGLVDQFAPIKELSKEAYGLLRLAKGSAGSFETLLRGGKLKLSDGVYDFDETKKGGVIDKLLIPMGGEHHDFLRWIAANRAEHLMGDDKEHLFTRDDIEAIKTLADGDLVFDYTLQHGPRAGRQTRQRAEMYADSLITFNGFHENVLDMAEQSGLIDQGERATWTSEFYVPFYRVAEENGTVGGVSMRGGSVRKQAFKLLMGGTSVLNADLLDNTLMNWANLLDASAKNRAAKASLEAAEAAGVAISTDEETARQMGKATGNRKGVVWFMDAGQPHYYLVDDPYVLQAITSLEYAGMRSPLMNALSAAKNVLTIGVTASPYFKIRNLIRDSVQVIGTSGIGYNPIKNVADGWKLTNPENDIYFRLLAGGGTIHFGTMLEGSEAKRVQALVESGVDAATILGDDHKIKAFYRKFIEPGITAYNELGNRGEAVNRATLYNQLVKQGLSHADASLQARDLMDFSMQGSFTTVRLLTQVVPFLNARIQGLYKLGRAAKEDPKRMAYVTGAVAMASLALLALYGDDDDWKKREEWDRNNFWWFKFGGTAFRIPKPFELGAIGTLAERSAELVFDNEMTATRFRTQVMTLLGDNLSMNPIPQLVKPMLDVYANKDSFSGRPIETMGMDKLKSDYRFTGATSMTARATSTALNSVTGLVGAEALSPVQVDSLIRGYFGWLGTFIVGTADMSARYVTNQPTRPSTDLWKLASGGMLSKLEDAPSRYVNHVYEQAKILEEAYSTWHSLQKEGKVEEAKEFRVANDDKIKAYRNVEAIKGAITKINQQIRMVERGDMERDAKRAEVNRLNARKDQFARRLVE